MNRRNFILTLVRGSIFTGVTAISGYVLFKEKNNSENCNFDYICKSCSKLDNCKLPEASRFKAPSSKSQALNPKFVNPKS